MDKKAPSIAFGPTNGRQLWFETISRCVDKQAAKYGEKEAVRDQYGSTTFKGLQSRSVTMAKALVDIGIQHGDTIGIMAGNRQEYIDIFLGGARIGAWVAVLNNTFTPDELRNALKTSGCKGLFLATSIGSRSMSAHIDMAIRLLDDSQMDLRDLVIIGKTAKALLSQNVKSFSGMEQHAQALSLPDETLRDLEIQIKPDDVVNLQFTSGTTGRPKAAMLSHINILNNGLLVGDAMELTPDDTVSCSPPLFHCFGLVMGFLATLTHGCCIVFPSETFDAEKSIDTIYGDKCTATLGVPTMFFAKLETLHRRGLGKAPACRTGLNAGASVPSALMQRIHEEMGVEGMLIAYGMTETSPVTIMCRMNDPIEKRKTSIGKVMPHSGVKIVDRNGRIVPRGHSGEILSCGYSLQKGYFRNQEKTDEVMKRDENGTLWMHTGDIGYMDEEGYFFVSGRIKDMIIRAGENIYPAEIEERLVQHPAVAESSIVGIPDDRYGEAVGAFLVPCASIGKLPSDDEITEWVRHSLGRHKAPKHIFWIGPGRILESIPKTASGKHLKHVLRNVAEKATQQGNQVRTAQARL